MCSNTSSLIFRNDSASIPLTLGRRKLADSISMPISRAIAFGFWVAFHDPSASCARPVVAMASIVSTTATLFINSRMVPALSLISPSGPTSSEIVKETLPSARWALPRAEPLTFFRPNTRGPISRRSEADTVMSFIKGFRFWTVRSDTENPLSSANLRKASKASSSEFVPFFKVSSTSLVNSFSIVLRAFRSALVRWSFVASSARSSNALVGVVMVLSSMRCRALSVISTSRLLLALLPMARAATRASNFWNSDSTPIFDVPVERLAMCSFTAPTFNPSIMRPSFSGAFDQMLAAFSASSDRRCPVFNTPKSDTNPSVPGTCLPAKLSLVKTPASSRFLIVNPLSPLRAALIAAFTPPSRISRIAFWPQSPAPRSSAGIAK